MIIHARTLDETPMPVGAVKVWDWENPDPTDDEAEPTRGFLGVKRTIDTQYGEIEIHIGGTQYSDGRVQREIRVDRSGDSSMSIVKAREVAAALLEVTDAVEAADNVDGRTWGLR
jgi:hypothetical protein